MSGYRGVTIQTPGLSPAFGDARWLRRFVVVGGVSIETARVRSQVDQSGGNETVLENPTGVVQGGAIPANADADSFLEASDGGRFGQRVKITRVGNTPVLAGIRAEGTYAAPTPPLSGATLFQVNSRPVVQNNGPSQVTGALVFVARENIGAAAWGTAVRVQAGRVGAAVSDEIVGFQSGGAGIAEIESRPATLRLLPGATAFVIRDSGNTFDAHSFPAAGTSASLAQSATTAQVNVGSGTGSGQTLVTVRGAAGQLRSIELQTGSSSRWIIRADNIAESGGNAGSDFRLLARTDAGAAIDDPIVIARVANGAITFGGVGNRQVIIAGAGWGAGGASLRLNGLTSGAGAGAGTLTNAPAAGNPAFWVPINVNGTVRHFPAW